VTAVHIVQSGEHIGVIANSFGFENFSELWNHPNNAALKEQRKSPFLLAPGDELFIPDRTLLVFSRSTAASHDFKVNVDRIQLQLRLLGQDSKPLKDAKVKLQVDPAESGAASSQREQTLTTDGAGKIVAAISKTCLVGGLVVGGLEYELKIGGLDPLDTDTGLAQRLTNLGYFVPPFEDGVVQDAGADAPATSDADDAAADDAADADGETEAAPPPPTSDDLRSAIEEFQCDQGLKVNGKKDDAAMLAKLEELHGS
jgi:N-acetylmuramoyl-L-alanine amidase